MISVPTEKGKTMTNKEAIEIITHFDKHIIPCDEYGYRIDSDLMEAHLMAAKALRNGWIPVTERLPEKDVKVLTFGVYGFSVNYRDRFSGKWRGVNGKPQWLTHWMPLPEPPKEEDHD